MREVVDQHASLATHIAEIDAVDKSVRGLEDTVSAPRRQEHAAAGRPTARCKTLPQVASPAVPVVRREFGRAVALAISTGCSPACSVRRS